MLIRKFGCIHYRWRPVGGAKSGELSAARDFRAVPMASHHCCPEKQLVPLVCAFPGTKIESHAGWRLPSEAGAVRPAAWEEE